MQPVTLAMAETLQPPPSASPLLERLRSLGMPGGKSELYRHFPIKALLERTYRLVQAETPAARRGKRLVIENGRVASVPEGVTVTAGSCEADGGHDDPLYFLGHLLAPRTILIETADDTVFSLHHRIVGTQLLLPYRIVLKTAPRTRVQVYETFESAGSAQSLMLYGLDASVGEGGTLRWVRSENTPAGCAAVIGSHRFAVAEGGTLELKTFDFGGGDALHLSKIDLDAYARTNATHLLLASGNAHRGNIVRIRHNRPHAESVQEARSILREKATGIFDGRITVARDARGARARQHSRAIQLDEHAFMYTKPQLEIYTDELEASHGAVTGRLDEDALFYLRSRGIAPEKARKMLVLAFANTLIDALGNAALAERIRSDFEAAYFGR